MGQEQRKVEDKEKGSGRLSLQPIPFEEAVGDILKVKPPPEKKKRRGKRRKLKEKPND